VNLGGFQFTNGVYTHVSEVQTVEALAIYLERCYYAFPVGSKALRAAQERYEREQESGTAENGDTQTAQIAEDEVPNPTVKEAIEQLDHANDEHWTAAGLPSLDVVSDLAGLKVTRQVAEVTLPGYN